MMKYFKLDGDGTFSFAAATIYDRRTLSTAEEVGILRCCSRVLTQFAYEYVDLDLDNKDIARACWCEPRYTIESGSRGLT